MAASGGKKGIFSRLRGKDGDAPKPRTLFTAESLEDAPAAPPTEERLFPPQPPQQAESAPSPPETTPATPATRGDSAPQAPPAPPTPAPPPVPVDTLANPAPDTAAPPRAERAEPPQDAQPPPPPIPRLDDDPLAGIDEGHAAAASDGAPPAPIPDVFLQPRPVRAQRERGDEPEHEAVTPPPLPGAPPDAETTSVQAATDDLFVVPDRPEEATEATEVARDDAARAELRALTEELTAYAQAQADEAAAPPAVPDVLAPEPSGPELATPPAPPVDLAPPAPPVEPPLPAPPVEPTLPEAPVEPPLPPAAAEVAPTPVPEPLGEVGRETDVAMEPTAAEVAADEPTSIDGLAVTALDVEVGALLEEREEDLPVVPSLDEPAYEAEAEAEAELEPTPEPATGSLFAAPSRTVVDRLHREAGDDPSARRGDIFAVEAELDVELAPEPEPAPLLERLMQGPAVTEATTQEESGLEVGLDESDLEVGIFDEEPVTVAPAPDAPEDQPTAVAEPDEFAPVAPEPEPQAAGAPTTEAEPDDRVLVEEPDGRQIVLHPAPAELPEQPAAKAPPIEEHVTIPIGEADEGPDGPDISVHEDRLDNRPGPIELSPSEALALAERGRDALRRRGVRRG